MWIRFNLLFVAAKFLRNVRSFQFVLIIGSLRKDDQRRTYVAKYARKEHHLKIRVVEPLQGRSKQLSHFLDIMKETQHTGKLKNSFQHNFITINYRKMKCNLFPDLSVILIYLYMYFQSLRRKDGRCTQIRHRHTRGRFTHSNTSDSQEFS